MHEIPLSITLKRLFPNPRSEVFSAFSSASNIANWLSPNVDIVMEVLSMAFEINGKFRFCFTEPDGIKRILGGQFKEIDSPERLVFSWTWEAPHIYSDIHTIVTVDFVNENKQTLVVLKHEQLSSEESCMMHKVGWIGALSRLDQHLPEH